MKNKKISFSRKIILRVSLYLVVSFVAFLVFAKFMIYSQINEQTDKRMRFLMDYLTTTLVEPLWNFENENIKEILDKVASDSIIHSISLTGSSGEKIYEYEDESEHEGEENHEEYNDYNRYQGNGDGEDITSVFQKDKKFALYRKIITFKYKDKDEVVGDLKIYISSAKTQKFFYDFIYKSIAITTCFVLILIIALARGISSMVHPLETISQQLAHINEKNQEDIKPIKTDIIELETLHSALVKMKNYYDSYQDKLEETVHQRTAELEKYKDSLEVMVAEQVRDIKTAKERAERASAAKTEFLSNMSHEMRTPMHAIISYSEMGFEKLGRVEEEKIRKFFDNINKSGRRLLSLINDLLDLSKLESGRMMLSFELCNIQDSVNSVIIEIEALSKNKNIEIRQSVGTLDLELYFDKVRMSQVIMNLLSNAIKFSEEGSKIKIEYFDYDDAHIAVSVEDGGVGIPEDELKTIFDKFVQSSKTRSGSGGTGLGLSISREIILAHKGKIWAENIATGGSKFTFIIPRDLN